MPRLRVKQINTVGFVDKGDDPEASIIFWKRMPKEAETYAEVGNADRIRSEMWRMTEAISMALHGAIFEAEGDQDPGTLIKTSLEQFVSDVMRAAPAWLSGEPMLKRVVQRGDEWCVTSEDGSQTLGCHPTREAAVRQLAAVEANKGGLTMKSFWKRLGEIVGMSPEEADELLADGAEGGSAPNNGADPGGTGMNDVEKLQAEKEALLKRAEEAESRVAELEKAAGEGEGVPKPEDVPEELRKRFEALEARAEAAEVALQKAHDEQERKAYIAKAATLSALPGVNPDDFGPLLRKAEAGLSEDERNALDEVLKAANAAMLTSRLYAEIGGAGGDASSSVMAEVTKLAEEKREKDPTLSLQAARGQVMKERKDLRDALEKERAALTKHLRTED